MYCIKISVSSYCSLLAHFMYQCAIFVLEVMTEQTKHNVDVLFIYLNLWQISLTTLPKVADNMDKTFSLVIINYGTESYKDLHQLIYLTTFRVLAKQSIFLNIPKYFTSRLCITLGLYFAVPKYCRDINTKSCTKNENHFV